MKTLNVNRVDFVKSAAAPAQFIRSSLPAVAFAGKSNVGKSSVINRLLNRKNFARVGSEPGKTVHVNYFLVGERVYWIDLPGYGYAKVSKAEAEKWGPMMEDYLSSRPDLLKVVQLVDIRHAPSAQDRQMYEYLQYYGLDGLVVATKADKVSRGEAAKNIAVIRRDLKLKKGDRVIPVSALNKTGTEEILAAMEEILLVGKQENTENGEDA